MYYTVTFMSKAILGSNTNISYFFPIYIYIQSLPDRVIASSNYDVAYATSECDVEGDLSEPALNVRMPPYCSQHKFRA